MSPVIQCLKFQNSIRQQCLYLKQKEWGQRRAKNGHSYRQLRQTIRVRKNYALNTRKIYWIWHIDFLALLQLSLDTIKCDRWRATFIMNAYQNNALSETVSTTSMLCVNQMGNHPNHLDKNKHKNITESAHCYVWLADSCHAHRVPTAPTFLCCFFSKKKVRFNAMTKKSKYVCVS